MISGTITDASGRTLSGQTTEAFWNSVRHARPLLRRPQLRARRDAAAPLRRGAGAGRRHDRWSAPTPTPACRTSSASTTRRRSTWPALMREFAEAGLVNIVGGCCGTTPEHIRAIAEAVAGLPPARARAPPRCACPGSSRSTSARTPTSSTSASAPTSPARRSSQADQGAGDYDAALEVARQQVENGAQIIDVNMDEGMLDSEAAMTTLPQPDRRRARHRRVPVMIDSSKWEVIEAGPQVRAGQGSSTRSA
jgi:5-methyltetrahydrofolate--homocysteine methyltransferase